MCGELNGFLNRLCFSGILLEKLRSQVGIDRLAYFFPRGSFNQFVAVKSEFFWGIESRHKNTHLAVQRIDVFRHIPAVPTAHIIEVPEIAGCDMIPELSVSDGKELGRSLQVINEINDLGTDINELVGRQGAGFDSMLKSNKSLASIEIALELKLLHWPAIRH